jgi:signal transduction histidine kinase
MVAPHGFALARLAPHELAALGARVRRCAEDRAGTLDDIAHHMVDAIWDAFDGPAPSQLALVRAYRTRPLCTLPAEQRAQVAAGLAVADTTRCLVLSASRGIEPAWNDPAMSASHRAIALSDPAIAIRFPMIAKLVRDLGLDPDAALRPALDDAVFFVADAIGSEHIPAQREFALRYGVRSVVGCGGTLPDGECFALVVFARVVVGADIAAGFSTLALHAALGLTAATDLQAPPAQRDRERAAAYDRLLRLQEYLYIRQATALAHAGAAETERAAGLAASLEREQHAGATKLARIQRAMINVIEDLRDARADLERKVAARTLELAQINTELRATNAELEQFAYVASHDLQEPLRTIAGYIQLLEERYGERIDGDGREFIAYAVRGAQRMQQLIEALLAYSQVSRAQLEVADVSLDRALDEVLQGMAASVAESGIAIERGALPVVRGDMIQLRQLLQNLLSNAIKFAGDRRPRVEIRAVRREREIELSVTDHGVGFDPKYAEQVFKVFRRLQRKQPGTGIGLAICKKIAERHGGTIRAESEPGCGTTFYVTLPAAEAR